MKRALLYPQLLEAAGWGWEVGMTTFLPSHCNKKSEQGSRPGSRHYGSGFGGARALGLKPPSHTADTCQVAPSCSKKKRRRRPAFAQHTLHAASASRPRRAAHERAPPPHHVTPLPQFVGSPPTLRPGSPLFGLPRGHLIGAVSTAPMASGAPSACRGCAEAAPDQQPANQGAVPRAPRSGRPQGAPRASRCCWKAAP